MTRHGASTLPAGDLVGSDKYVRVLAPVANESCPTAFIRGATLAVTGIAGLRADNHGL